ncbi:MAG: MBL fold metallo-hydrolase [Desulfuromonadales bacterium]|nr:MBL fold metallo-hydrolase [Desulfuromonadales bacterium]
MNNEIQLEHLAVGPLQVNCFLVACPQSREALVIDPGDDPERILALAEQAGLQIRSIINTHGHFDHVGGNHALVAACGAQLLIHGDDLRMLGNAEIHARGYGLQTTASPAPDRLLADGDRIEIGSLAFQVIHVPGHSPGGIALYGHGHLFAGDILFAGSIGRTDLPGGDHDRLIDGIRQKLLVLPDETIVHTGHGPDTTIGREKQTNPYIGLSGGAF